jgi:Fibronectin type III domain
VTWDPPPYSGVLGYRVYYDMNPEHDIEEWHSIMIGPYTVTEINGLESHSDYAVRVRARIGENKYSNFSETVVTNKADPGMFTR